MVLFATQGLVSYSDWEQCCYLLTCLGCLC